MAFRGTFVTNKQDAQLESQLLSFCEQSNIDIIAAEINGHRAIGLVKKLIQTIERKLGCKREKDKTHFYFKSSVKQKTQ